MRTILIKVFILSSYLSSVIALTELPSANANVERTLRTQHHLHLHSRFVQRRHRLKCEIAQKVQQYRLHLGHCKLLSDAVARPGREWHIRERMSALHVFWQEAVRIEALRVWEDVAVSVQLVDEHKDNATGRNCVVGKLELERRTFTCLHADSYCSS